MKTELIVILATNKGEVSTPRFKLEIVGHYEAELDDQPGLAHVMQRVESADERDFFALRISADRAVTLQAVQAAPQFHMEISTVPAHPTEPDEDAGERGRHWERGRCWGCDNDRANPEQHAGDCPSGQGGGRRARPKGSRE